LVIPFSKPLLLTGVIAAAVLSFGQTSVTKKPLPAKSDTWQRSKECAAQAEKMVAEWPWRSGSAPEDWHNHYTWRSKDEKFLPS
jgi:hypothetical protein